MIATTRQVRPHADITLPVLAVPMPNEPFASCTHESVESVEPALPPVTVPDAPRRAFYRWILGHHGSVCVWRLLAEALARGDAGVEHATALYHGYSALLLYSGSCTRETYNAAIRPRMRERDEAFSGTWARDYDPLRSGLQRVHPAPGTPLRRAVLLNRLVHMTVGHRLVPNDRSLLRLAGRDPHIPPSESERAQFDDFFMIHRQPVCRHEFAAQFSHRIELIRADLAACPVDAEYQQGEVTEFQADLATHLDLSAPAGELLSLTEPRNG